MTQVVKCGICGQTKAIKDRNIYFLCCNVRQLAEKGSIWKSSRPKKVPVLKKPYLEGSKKSDVTTVTDKFKITDRILLRLISKEEKNDNSLDSIDNDVSDGAENE